ncbi:MAG: cupin domain-containing protein [Desulfobacteraceae bacterium]|nr:cupin domain-containing protein [Desulfobacteraceae bacterium]
MKVVNYKDVLPVVMDNEMVKNVAGRLMIGKEDHAKNFCMRVFEIGKDGYTPKHTHEWEHEVFVHTGTGEVFIESEWYPLSKGSAVFVPANIEHQFRNISDEIFTFVCLIPSGAPEL